MIKNAQVEISAIFAHKNTNQLLCLIFQKSER